MEGRLADLKEAMKGQDVSLTRARMEAVNQLLHRISAAAYQRAGAEAEAGEQPRPEGPRRPGEEETIEAEFEEK